MRSTTPMGMLVQLIGAVFFVWGLVGLLFWGKYAYILPMVLGAIIVIAGRLPSRRHDDKKGGEDSR